MQGNEARLLRVLAIDGGGVRGLLPATILVLLEQKLQEKTNNPSARLSDFFDLVAGTSTGGILTCLLLLPGADGRPKYSANDVLDFYKTKMTTVFQRTVYDRVTSVWGWDGPQYSAQPYEALLKQYAGDALLSQLLRPCVLTSYNIDAGEPFFFCNSSIKSEMPYDFYVRDVARSTSAAPTYFPPSEIVPLQPPAPPSASPASPSTSSPAPSAPAVSSNVASSTPTPAPPANIHLIDGGVFANNPTLCAYAQARQMTIGKNHKVHLKDMFILSLSCGEQKCTYSAAAANKWGKLGWAMPLINIMMDGNSATVDFQLRELFNAIGAPEQYIRLDPPLTKSSDALDDCSAANLKHLQEDLDSFLALPDTKAALDRTIDALVSGQTPHLAKEPKSNP